MATGKDPFEVEQKLEQVVPAQYKSHAHHWLILTGATLAWRAGRYARSASSRLCQCRGTVL